MVGMLISACAKDEATVEAETIQLPIQGAVRELRIADDSLYIAGDHNRGGGLVMSDTLLTRFTRLVTLPAGVYSLFRFDGSLWVWTAKATLYHGPNLKHLEPFYFVRKDWIGNLYKQPIKSAALPGCNAFVCGGGQLKFGVAFVHKCGSNRWYKYTLDNELEVLIPCDDSVFAFGNGVRLSIAARDDTTWHKVVIEGTHIIDAVRLGNGDLVAIGTKGQILKSTNRGLKWKMIRKVRGTFFNVAAQIEGGMVAFGNEGVAVVVKGESVKKLYIDPPFDIISAVHVGDHYVLGTRTGQLLRIPVSAIDS